MATHLIVLLVLLFSIALGGSYAQNTRKELRTKETNEDGHPVQAKIRTDPSRVVQLSWQPRVFLYRDFLSDKECDYLISWARGNGNYTVTGDKSINFSIIMNSNDEIAKIIEERIFAWTFLPKENSKSMNIQHFGPEESTKKYNYFQNETEEQVDQPLLATVILYLSNVSQGGQILFPQSEDKMWSDCAKTNEIFKHSKGNAMVFFNLHVNATPDRTSSHARCPILRGDMWCATKFFYLKSISSTKDLIQSDGGNCTDEDENCPRWAAIGECQRNPVFMKGSSDYYGACMKSCNAC